MKTLAGRSLRATLEWKIQSDEVPDSLVSASQEFGIKPWLVQLLAQRNIHTAAQIRTFFNSASFEVPSAMLLSDMDKALELLIEGVEKKNKWLVFGDYDVDGTTATAMFSNFLREFEVAHDCYIPDRFNEGYGLSMEAVGKAIEEKYDVLITLDCGIRAIKPIAKAKKSGIKVIVCDHHEPGTELPNADAILNPKKEHDRYPFKGLSGAGVGFKLMQAFYQEQGFTEDHLVQHLDLLALSIAADIVPVQEENRYYLARALNHFNERPMNDGLELLLSQAKKAKPLNVQDLVFTLAPRINAAGRMENGKLAVDLMRNETSRTKKEQLAARLNQLNMERRSLDMSTREEALKQAVEHDAYGALRSVVVHAEQWNKGVIGIVASKLVEAYNKPSIVFAQDGDEFTGSARSIEGVDVHEVLQKCAHLLVRYGGHAMAAGLTLKVENLESFRVAFDEEVLKQLPDLPTKKILIDAEVPFNEWTEKTVRSVLRMAPFGPENQRPVFYSSQVLLDAEPQLMGKEREHVRMTLRADEYSSTQFKAVFFNGAEVCNSLKAMDLVDIVYDVNLNHWNGNSEVQIRIKDLRLA